MKYGYPCTREQEKIILKIIKRSKDRVNTGYAIRVLMLSKHNNKTKALKTMLKSA